MENLNIVLTMSTDRVVPGEEEQQQQQGNRLLRGYCRKYPALLGHTTINWMSGWPKEAWTCIAKAYLGEHPKVRPMTRMRMRQSLIKEVRWLRSVIITRFHCLVHLPLSCTQIPEQHREAVIAHTVRVHETAQLCSKELRHKYRQVNYVTPKHFLGYIMTFLDLIGNNNII